MYHKPCPLHFESGIEVWGQLQINNNYQSPICSRNLFCKFLTLREYYILLFNRSASNRESIKSQAPNFFFIVSFSLHLSVNKKRDVLLAILRRPVA